MTDPLDRLQSALSNRYTIERELGRGGMAVVYLAHDQKLNRPVALKVLRPELAASLGSERFLREIQIAAKLTHPNILGLHDCGEADGQLYYTMPYVEGESLRDRLTREKQLPIDDALQITKEVADALGHAHALGIVHRDIKPENILFQGGHAVVSDFGIARAVSEAGAETLTETGLAVGTPAYMSPEQASGSKDIEARSDLYSLGCVLYEMLSGEPPHLGNTPQAIVAKKLTEPAPRVSVIRDKVPPAVEAALDTVLSRTPADRFTTAEQFAAALTAEAAALKRLAPRVPRVRQLVVGGAAVIVATVGVWAVAVRPSGTEVADPYAIPLDSTAIAVLPFRVVGGDNADVARSLAQSMGMLAEQIVTGEYGVHLRHSGSVEERWRDAGGTLDTALSEEAELAVAHAVGAGRLVRGAVVEHGDSVTLSATMIDVYTGRVSVPAVRVEGPIARRFDLVDQLIIQLLARARRYSGQEAARLARYKPEAIQALLAGRPRQALSLDSNLIEAAFRIYQLGEKTSDTAELRYAWEHRDQLPEWMRAYLGVLAAGRHGDIRTRAQVIVAYEALGRQWPENGRIHFELAEKLGLFGRLTGETDWLRRAGEALRRNRRSTPLNAAQLWRQVDLAFDAGDTTSARLLLDSLAALPRQGGALATVYRWRLAAWAGDTAAVRTQSAALAGVPGGLNWTIHGACQEGRAIAEVDRLVDTVESPLAETLDIAKWGWVRGKERWWQAGWRADSLRLLTYPPGELTVPVYRALLLGMPTDSSVLRAARRLEQLARDSTGPAEVRVQAVVWTALWRMHHGDADAGRAAVRLLERMPDRPYRFVGWIRLFDALAADASPGARRAALLALDSAVRPVPLGLEAWQPEPTEVQNLLLARMWREVGEPARGLAAIRRRQWCGYYWSWPEYLREEGGLAALSGDTAGAIEAFNHYLRLREDPDSLWRAQWDSVKTELAALVAR